MIDTKRYLLAFLITVALFASGFFASNFFSNKKIEEIKYVQDSIAIDILSNETQFDLLKQVPCATLTYSILSSELDELGEKIAYAENNVRRNDDEVLVLRKYYALLQIKDYLLSEQLGEKCAAKKPSFILYFYGDEATCEKCERTGAALSRLKEKYPELRVYSYDYDMPLSAVEAMKRIYKITPDLPALVIDGKTFSGYSSFEEIEKLLPESFKKVVATSTALVSSTTKR